MNAIPELNPIENKDVEGGSNTVSDLDQSNINSPLNNYENKIPESDLNDGELVNLIEYNEKLSSDNSDEKVDASLDLGNLEQTAVESTVKMDKLSLENITSVNEEKNPLMEELDFQNKEIIDDEVDKITPEVIQIGEIENEEKKNLTNEIEDLHPKDAEKINVQTIDNFEKTFEEKTTGSELTNKVLISLSDSEITHSEKLSAEIMNTEDNPREPVKAKAKSPKTKKSTENEPDGPNLLSAHDFTGEDDEHEIELAVLINYSTFSKIELIEKLEKLVKDPHINKIKSDITGIKIAYLDLLKREKQEHLNLHLANGGTKEEYIPENEPLEERFKYAFEIYKENKLRDDQEQEKIKIQNLELKKQILEEIKLLINSEDSLKKTYDDFKSLQDKWKQVGMVPRSEMEGLWNNYHFLVEKFFEKVKINKELKDLDLKKNLEAKISLCEKAEELLLEKSITRCFKLLQKYHDEWKEIGPVILDKKDEIWERFKNVSDKINEQRKEYYESLHGEQENNLLAKTALCEKIEEINAIEISSLNDWKEKTDQVLEMQKLWDSIGRAPIKFNDEIWERFRKGVNTFFNTKKDFFGELKDQQLNNYNLKIDICVQVESLVNSSNWRQATNEILKLQKDWKYIGAVPKRVSDKVWKRFRKACDEFFKRKSEYFSNIQGIENENKNKKEEIIERINTYEVSSDKKENLESLKNFQREWLEIGFVPIDAKEKLQFEFKKAINNLMDKLKISSTEVSTMNYKNRIENMQNTSDAKNVLYKERVFIEGKISKLKSEILQWENNIGFFASSKKANLLKEEFEMKIQGAKQELALLEAKLKLLKNNQ
jgi:hypothetical protein